MYANRIRILKSKFENANFVSHPYIVTVIVNLFINQGFKMPVSMRIKSAIKLLSNKSQSLFFK